MPARMAEAQQLKRQSSKRSSLNVVFDALRHALSQEHSPFDECKFMNEKRRRKSSADKCFQGDHLQIGSQPPILRMLKNNNDNSIEFTGLVTLITSTVTMEELVLIITDSTLYLLNTTTNKIVVKAPVASIASVSMSKLPDNFFALRFLTEDLLLVSWQKTEIISTLTDVYDYQMESVLPVNFANRFDVRFGENILREVVFEDSDTGVNTEILNKPQLNYPAQFPDRIRPSEMLFPSLSL